MNHNFNMNEAARFLTKWQQTLKLQDWDIKLYEVNQEWRKTGDIKIDVTDRKAILMLNMFNPKQTNLEALILHELLHLKLWGMDQMIDEMIKLVFGEDEEDPKYQFAFRKFMEVLEPTVEDLAKGFMSLGGEDKTPSYGRVEKQVLEEIGELV